MHTPPTPVKSMWTDIGGLTIHVRVAVDQAPAQAPVVVLVHGSGHAEPGAQAE